ncbi:MAG: HEAT repeat domain-containing protein [Myxococcales bacterium]|nr:MAG: HEAT repeat domain-containing protein [Myxococcales bacterium]
MKLFGPNVKKIAKWRQERNADMLLTVLNEPDFDLKAAAAEALGHIQHQAAANVLAGLLTHPLSSKVRAEAASALGRIRATTAIPKLIGALDDENSEVVKAIRGAIANMGDAAIPSLIGNLNNFYRESIRKACKELLLQYGSRAVEPLVKGLLEGTYGIREESAILLGKTTDPRAREALLSALMDKRIEVRKAAAAALDSIKWQPSQDLYGAYYYLATRNVEKAAALGTMAIPALVAWLADDDAQVRRQIAVTLNKVGWRPTNRKEAALFYAAAGKFSEVVKFPEEAAEILIRLLSDRNVQVKRSAAMALKHIGVPPSVKSLVRDIEQMSDITLFRLKNGTFNLEKIALEGASFYKGKYYLLRVDNCDDEQIAHIKRLYPEAEIIPESEAQ